MEDPDPPIQPKPRNSHSLFTPILIILTLILLSLLPSQAPESLNQTLISNLWGLMYLLIIGIVVSYGLFSRRNTTNEPKLDANERYLAENFQFSNVFGNGFDNFNGCDEKLVVDSWKWSPIFDKWENPRFGIQSRSERKCDHDKPLNLPIRSLKMEFIGNSCNESDKKASPNLVSERFCNKNISQAQNYGTISVFNREKCDLDNWGNPKLIDDYKPLNLPVRSLMSNIPENRNSEIVNEIGTNFPRRSLRSKIPVNSSEIVDEIGTNFGSESFGEKNDEIKKIVIRGLVPINLEKKFEEVIASPSPIPWSSRSSKIEEREKVKPPSHTRLEIENLKSKEAKLGRNKTEKVVCFSSLGDFPFEKLENSEVNQNVGKGKSRRHSRTLSDKEFDYTKVEKIANPMKVKDEKRKAKSPPSIGEFRNSKKELDTKTDNLEMRRKESESFWSSIYSPINSPSSAISTDEKGQKVENSTKKKVTFELNSEQKAGTNSKTREEYRERISRGKSVRTVRTNKSCLIDRNRGENCSDPMDEKAEKPKELNLENVSVEKSSILCGLNKAQTKKASVNPSEKADFASSDNEELDTNDVDKKADFELNLDNISVEKSSTFCGLNKAQTKKVCVNHSEKADFATADDEELDTDEVDKKADVELNLENISVEKSSTFCGCHKTQTKKVSVNPNEKADNEELDTNDVDKKAEAFIAKFEKTKELNLVNISMEKSSNFCGSNKAQTKKESENPSEKADFDELDSDEVDKKADAFIAKFREQIRLQKIDSIKRKC